MRGIMKWIFKIYPCVFLLFFTDLSFAETVSSCFKETESLAFFNTIKEMNLSSDEAASAVSNSCSEVTPGVKSKETHTKPGKVTEIKDRILTFLAYGSFGGGASAFSKMKDTPLQQNFMKALEKIKENPNRYERIRDTYKLVSRYQGEYDYETLKKFSIKGLHIWSTPEAVVNDAQTMGSGGVCRNFASLLTWSLLQVARPKGNTSMALDETSFSTEFIAGDVVGGGHRWVRVNLPKKIPGKGIEFKSIDLDTTWYPATVTALQPRLDGLTESEMQTLSNKCKQIILCLWNLPDPENSQKQKVIFPPSSEATSVR